MSQIRTGHFEADGGAHNLILGFVPSYLRIMNFMAADTEVAVIEWFKEMGDAVEIWWMNSDTGEQNFVPKGSGGYISEYDANSVQSSEPVKVLGGQGVTIDAAFMEDSDEIYYFAIEADRDVDHGDIA